MGFLRFFPLIVYALISAYTDIRYRKINLFISAAAALSGICCIYTGGFAPGALTASLAPGICLMGLSVLSKGCIGLGDAVYIMICGIYLDAPDVLILLVITWIICAAAALIILALRGQGKYTGSRGIPFAAVSAPILICITAEHIIGGAL